MSAQQSLLDLFNAQSAGNFSADENDAGAKQSSPRRALNPFRKQIGICAHCPNTQNPKPDTRLFWCHLCGGTGCMDWLKEHKD